MMRNILILLAILIFSQMAFSQSSDNSYSNARFGYTISYPNSLIPQGEAPNGDGQVFKNDDAELRIYGSNLLLHDTLRKEYNAILKEKGKKITYKTFGKKFFAISGTENGKVFYQKTTENSGGSFITIQFEYKTSKRTIYDKATTKIVKSLQL